MTTSIAPSLRYSGFQTIEIDWTLLVTALMLASIGLLMIGSASMSVSESFYDNAWYIVSKHGAYLAIGLLLSLVMFKIPTSLWQQYSWVLLLGSVLLLLLVLVPGIGKRVNGSQRWIVLGPGQLQVSEVVKFCLIVFFAQFLSVYHQVIKTSWRGFLPPCGIVVVVALLLLLEPDFGAAVVISCTVFAMLFIAGAKLWQFACLALVAVGSLAAIAIASPYRLKRLVSFLDPWADQFDSGYQLTQSLVAFGNGNWFGVGFGNGLQKLLYLPDAHTDFVFAIVAEEFGLLGVLAVTALFGMLVYRILKLSRRAALHQQHFISLASFGVGFLFAAQALINIGVTCGALPTKGLTLPFISYGGSSVIVSCVLIAFVLRMHWELLGQPASGRGVR